MPNYGVMPTVPGVPECMSWDVPAVGTSIHEWQRGRCAACGDSRGPLVEDHDHHTGLVRGYLCRSCNTHEGISDAPRWVRWRSGWHPAAILGVEIEYAGNWAYQLKRRGEELLGEATEDELRAAVNLLGDAS